MEHEEKNPNSFILNDKYTELKVKKEDGTVVASITKNDANVADGYTIVLIPNYEYTD